MAGMESGKVEMQTLEDRIDRLEKLYEKSYHEMELLSIYIPKLTDILIKYFNTSERHREAVMRDYLNVVGHINDLRKKFDEFEKPASRKKVYKY